MTSLSAYLAAPAAAFVAAKEALTLISPLIVLSSRQYVYITRHSHLCTIGLRPQRSTINDDIEDERYIFSLIMDGAYALRVDSR